MSLTHQGHFKHPKPFPYLTGMAYIPRWIGGVMCYVVFGIGGLLSSLTILPVLRFWPGSKQQRIARVQKAVHYMFKGFVWMLTFTGLIKVSAPNTQALADAKGMIVIANHPTLIDVVVLISLIPNAGCIVKQSLWRNPFMRGVLSSAGYIPNRGAELLLKDCQQVLNDSTNLIIFPEGTRTVVGTQINPFARGAANIAIRTRTDILPVLLHVDVAGLTKQQPWYEPPRQTVNMSVEIGAAFDQLRYDINQTSDAKMARVLTRELEQLYSQQITALPPLSATTKK
ncbi:lysophospholipid acyltransferase family protein [Shewanella sp. 1_MG-2023]|uniref:1-acyl-sn-glycerol-3-phosphate acyltransferase n=1 Tax=Shewanella electrodiphila TaxID=934143 RepID=A0ABT0KUA0_9GAMM|nr:MULTISPECIES: lysophospholipid acyltransferase family protein [Shewanella]MCL1047421.1 1-acyl-sn-glycerol-3-phosphate acyltransferase [Shewanella electrodiphila]MDO6612959.1 lysophospholipid acyltransferase family protein [Shewanella sp. 7_MG-2023]MDO6772861.1 lysophospholipid acyltransferase family protein [Shewanella sp. 2_MG-2023]MDO6795091.1 lysophospholipid acyltransferase family protein [Shewanella sp. 1_MG-2023]PMG79002.1 glycerol acyltransferase [Shewanella sp. 10N.286.51.B7]